MSPRILELARADREAAEKEGYFRDLFPVAQLAKEGLGMLIFSRRLLRLPQVIEQFGELQPRRRLPIHAPLAPCKGDGGEDSLARFGVPRVHRGLDAELQERFEVAFDVSEVRID